MKRDISKILDEWPFSPGQISARTVEGPDGSDLIQVRLDLGIIQMWADGRPDGKDPRGHESLLEFHESTIDPEPGREGRDPSDHTDRPPPLHGPDDPEAHEHGAADGPGGEHEPGSASPFSLSLTTEDCRSLREEAAQYYQRYVACLVLDDFERVIRDTTRNLRVLDLCAKHAQADHDRVILEQFRPYIIMIRARALASQAMRESEPKAAVFALDEAVESLRRYLESTGRAHLFEESSEVQMLREMRDALVPKLPVSQHAELAQRLQRAVEAENYELAAILRDEIKQLKESEFAHPSKASNANKANKDVPRGPTEGQKPPAA